MMNNRNLTLQPPGSEWWITYDLSRTIEYFPVTSVLDLLASVTRSDAAHFYWVDPAANELRLTSASFMSEDGRIPRVRLRAARRWLETLSETTILSSGEDNFACFPETVASRVSNVLVQPLHTLARFMGALTLCRSGEKPYGATEMEIASKLSRTLVPAMQDFHRRNELTSLRERLNAAQQENQLLEKRLAERKLVERAKGLLQLHYGWTEEDAYYHLRRTSRQQRTPMAAIAQRIIDVTAPKETARERLSA